uniref:Uncharacterized protein n=1 Tax=Arundo donax TaxID=35708 RepID=A0A0A8YQV9_ARUDO
MKKIIRNCLATLFLYISLRNSGVC